MSIYQQKLNIVQITRNWIAKQNVYLAYLNQCKIFAYSNVCLSCNCITLNNINTCKKTMQAMF